jgi:hypothetical protein
MLVLYLIKKNNMWNKCNVFMLFTTNDQKAYRMIKKTVGQNGTSQLIYIEMFNNL